MSSSVHSRNKIGTAVVHELGSRTSQQDAFGIEDSAKSSVLAVLADGMGGLVNSDQISQCIVSSMLDAYAPGSVGTDKHQLLLLIKLAIEKVQSFVSDKHYQSGSTVVACIVNEGKLSWVSVGDSRIYLWRNGGLIQLSRDHDLTRDLYMMSMQSDGSFAEADANPRKEALTSFIGLNFPREIDYNSQPVSLLRGDKVVLMSDGVYRALSETELNRCLGKHADRCAQKIRNKITAKKLPQQDNFTAVILEIK